MVNFNKNPVAPPSLAIEKAKGSNGGSYQMQDVLDTLEVDFHKKCYLCESRRPTSINVEHFDEHRGDLDKKFDWNNLFYACGHCNSTKNDMFRTGSSNLLNCTDPAQRVDVWLTYRTVTDDSTFIKKAVIEINSDFDISAYQVKAGNTVKLLMAIFNGTNGVIRTKEAQNLLDVLYDDLIDFKSKLYDFQNPNLSQEAHDSIATEIQQELEISSAYTAFKRWIIRDRGMEDQFRL